MTSIIASIVPALRALAVALLGVWLIAEARAGRPVEAVGILVLVGVIAYVVDYCALGLFPNYPVAATVLGEVWLVVPLLIAAVASAGMVLLAIHFTPADNVDPADKEVLKTLSTAIVTFLSTAFVSWAGDGEKSPMAERAKQRLRKFYQRPPAPPAPRQAGIKYFKPDSKGERLVQSDYVAGIEGWHIYARLRRATNIAQELKSGASDA